MMQALLAQDLIFIDETGVDLALTRFRARSPRGSRVQGKRPSKRGKRVSIISAINIKEVLCLMLEAKTRISISRATMGRMTQKLKLTVKKKHYIPMKKTLRECKSSG
jgi:hypothetical protein